LERFIVEKENYPVKTPKKWLDGWSKAYENMVDQNLEELDSLEIHYPVQLASYYVEKNNNGKRALDLATGDGRVACFLAKLGYEVEAIDALQNAIKITKKRAKSLNIEDKIKTVLGDIETYALNKEGYDFITALQCIQYLGEKGRSRLKELKDTVKKEGFFVYSGNIEPHFETDPPLKPYFITKEDLKDLFKNWTILSLGSEERLVKKEDRRGYVWIVAKNIPESEIKELKVR
jgi:2-polyprenyl-3-methyl-5-hydroxy-6-metoxy-1,4-benzoquinol methylase